MAHRNPKECRGENWPCFCSVMLCVQHDGPQLDVSTGGLHQRGEGGLAPEGGGGASKACEGFRGLWVLLPLLVFYSCCKITAN